MNKRKIIVLLVLFIAVIGFSMSSASAATKIIKTPYKYKNIMLSHNDAGIEKRKMYDSRYGQYVRIYDYDMSIYKVKFYLKKKGKYYTITYKIPKKYFTYWVPKGYNTYKVKFYYYPK